METFNTYDRFNYLENKKRISILRKNYYEKKKNDPEYKKNHSDCMKKYYQKRKQLRTEENKQIEESNEYLIQKILLHI